jgi:hypothetical protein
MSTRPGQEDTVGTFTQGEMLAWLTDAEQAIMASLGIRFNHGAYRFEDFRYDQLADAVNAMIPGFRSPCALAAVCEDEVVRGH